MTKKVVIIGAGIAGLSAGIHARRNGYEAEIYEMHDLPGGLCTAWQRKGYTFDGCIHYLVGTKPGSQFNYFWREIGALDNVNIIDHDVFMNIEADGVDEAVKIYCDLDRLEEHLTGLAPEDRAVLATLFEAARAFAGATWPLDKPHELYKIWQMPLLLFKMMPLFKVTGRYSRISIREYLDEVKNPVVKKALSLVIPEGYSMTSLLSTLAGFHNRDSGFPQGGSLKFVQSIAKHFLEMGGKIYYGCRVKEISVENNEAVGLLLEDGSTVQGDLVISAADLHHTAYKLLRGKYLTSLIKESFSELPTYSSVLVFLGVNADLSREAENIALKLDLPIKMGDQENHYLYLTNFSFDPTLAPPGKTVIRASLFSSYDYWSKLAKNRDLYRDSKEQLISQVVSEVKRVYPIAASQVEASDVATPVTFNRYTNVYRGAYMGWLAPPESGRFRIPKQIPNLENFYQIGQWLEPPAGLPGSMLSGRYAIQLICHAEKKPFRTI
jgi:phytoene desaturase